MKFRDISVLLSILILRCPSVFAVDTNTPKITKLAKTDVSSDVATSRHQVTVTGSRKKVSDSGCVGGSDNNEDDGDENDGDEDDKLNDLILNQVENDNVDYYDGNEETFCKDVDDSKDYKAIRINLDNNTTHYAQDDDFRKEYDEVSKMNEDDYADSPMMKILIQDNKFVKELERDIKTNPWKYASIDAQKKLVQDCNNQRFIVGTALGLYLPSDLLVNMANPHSEKATIGFHAHYCPPKTRSVEGVLFDFCNRIQCCMDTLLRKIPNYLANEHSGNVDMDLASYYGGRDAVFDKDRMVVNDLIPACIPKTDTDAEMVEQYRKIQTHLKLKKMLHLLMFSYNTQRRHLLIAQVCHPKKKFQLHITSSATAKYIMGNGAGVEKYLTTYVSKHFEITVGVHPQVFLLGANKSDSHYPPAVKKIMGRTLVEVYRNVLDLREGFEEKTEIMFKFGGDFKSVDAGAYSYVASRLEEEDILDLCKHVNDSLNADNTEDSKVKSAGDRVAEEKAAVETHLTSRRWPKADITLFTEQLDEAVTFELVIDRLKRFTAGHQMHTIAAQMTDEMFGDGIIPGHINSMIETLVSTLQKSRNRIMSSLMRIKTSQGGLALLPQLASIYNSTEGDESVKVAAIEDDDRLQELMKSYKIDDMAKAIEMIKNTAAAQGGLVPLGQLASIYNSTEGDESDKLAVIEGDIRLNDLMKAYKIDDMAKAIEMIKNTAAAQIRNGKSLALLGQLASVYNSTEGDESVKETVVKGDVRLDDLMKAYKIDDKEKAIEMIKNTAAAQIRNGKSLALLPQLASVYNSTEGDESDKLLVIEGDGRLDDLMKLYKIDDKAKAIEMIKNTAAAQERRQEGLVLFNQLVSRFSRAGSRDDGRAAIMGSDLDRLVERSLGSQEEVVAKIEKEAMKCDETFWDKYKELKAVKNKHMVEIEDDNGDTHTVLFVKPTEKGKDGTSVLYVWFAEQVKYSGISGTNNTDAYAVKAYKRVGSLEYQALAELGVSFDDKLNILAHDAIRSEGHKKISGGRKDLIDPSLNDTTLGDDTTLGEEPEIDTSIRFD